MKKEYYFCYIGPTDRDELDKNYPNGEGCIRFRIKEAFKDVTGHYADRCGSGWGVTEDQADQISFATQDDSLKKAIIQSYHNENKPLPRHMRAWELLFKEDE